MNIKHLKRKVMNKETLKKIAKTHKINLEHFDSVHACLNEAFTKVYVTFASSEVCGGTRRFCCKTDIRLSVASILKRFENIDDYLTNGWTWLYEIK